MPSITCKCGNAFNANVAGNNAKFPGSLYGTCPKCRQFCWDKNGSKFSGKKWVKEERGGKVAPTEPAHVPSDEQRALYDAVGSAALAAFHWLIIALAGTGKTFTLTNVARRFKALGRSVALVAFTSKDAKELDKRLNGDCPNGTVAYVKSNNGHGNDILKAHLRGLKLIDEHDGTALVKEVLRRQWIADGLLIPGGNGQGRDKWEGQYADFIAVVQLVDKARHCLPLRSPMRPTDGQWTELYVRFGIEAVDEATVFHYASAIFPQVASLEVAKTVGIDFGQQIFLPVYHGMKSPIRYDVVGVDEGQDQNFGCRALALMLLAPGGKMIVVGDTNQAIYAWRGADTLALATMEKALKNVKRFALTVCRRCSKAVTRTLQKLVPEITCLDEAPEGTSENHIPEPGKLVEQFLAEHKAGRKPAGYVICRTNAPLMSLVLKLMALGISARLQKGDMLSQLVSMVETVTNGAADMPIDEVLRSAGNWTGERVAKLATQRNSEGKIQVAQDKLACLHALADADEIRTQADLIGRIKSLYPADKDPGPDEMIVGATVHGAKGREANDVYILSPIPKKGNQSIFDAVWDGNADRNNTLYVACSRAKLNLTFVGPMPTLRPYCDEAPAEVEEVAEVA